MINKHGRMIEIVQVISDSPVLPRAFGIASAIRNVRGARRRCHPRGDFKKHEKEGKCEEATRIWAVGIED